MENERLRPPRAQRRTVVGSIRNRSGESIELVQTCSSQHVGGGTCANGSPGRDRPPSPMTAFLASVRAPRSTSSSDHTKRSPGGWSHKPQISPEDPTPPFQRVLLIDELDLAFDDDFFFGRLADAVPAPSPPIAPLGLGRVGRSNLLDILLDQHGSSSWNSFAPCFENDLFDLCGAVEHRGHLRRFFDRAYNSHRYNQLALVSQMYQISWERVYRQCETLQRHMKRRSQKTQRRAAGLQQRRSTQRERKKTLHRANKATQRPVRCGRKGKAGHR